MWYQNVLDLGKNSFALYFRLKLLLLNLKILLGILTPSGGKIKISIVNLLRTFYPNNK